MVGCILLRVDYAGAWSRALGAHINGGACIKAKDFLVFLLTSKHMATESSVE